MSHFYTHDGKPCHVQPTKSKTAKSPTRPTTIADAKKLKLLPSVTEIIKQIDKPQLTDWKIDQALTAMATLPFTDDELQDPDLMVAKAKRELAQLSEQYMGKGTEVHAALEHYILHDEIKDGNEEYVQYTEMFEVMMDEQFGDHEVEIEHCELPFGNANLGYGGCVDLILKDKTTNETWIIDFKTKATKTGKGIFKPDDYKIQTVAYKYGIGMGTNESVRCALMFFSTTEENRYEFFEVEQEKHFKWWTQFRILRDLWIAVKEWDPRAYVTE